MNTIYEALFLVFTRVFVAMRGKAREVDCGEGFVYFPGCAYHRTVDCLWTWRGDVVSMTDSWKLEEQVTYAPESSTYPRQGLLHNGVLEDEMAVLRF